MIILLLYQLLETMCEYPNTTYTFNISDIKIVFIQALRLAFQTTHMPKHNEHKYQLLWYHLNSLI